MKLGEFELNQIYCGDNAVLLKQLPEACIDLTVTSPPYDNLRKYKGYSFDFETVASELYRVTKPGGVVVWVVGDETKDGSESLTSFKQAIYFVDECGFNLHDTMIYECAGTGAKGSNQAYWQGYEFMFVFTKGNIKTVNRIKDVKNVRVGDIHRATPKMEGLKTRALGKRTITVGEFGFRTNIWRYQVGNNGNDITDHPAPFPESLAADHIRSWSNPGDIVLDPFMGSGTAAKMAHLLDRKWIGFEISQEYVDLANERLRPFENKLFEML